MPFGTQPTKGSRRNKFTAVVQSIFFGAAVKAILFVKFVEFVAVFTDYMATNSTNWHESNSSQLPEEFTAASIDCHFRLHPAAVPDWTPRREAW